VVRIGDTYYMTYAFKPYAWEPHLTGLGVQNSNEVLYPGFDGDSKENQTRSGIAVSQDRVHWKRFEVYIPGVSFPIGNVVVDDLLYLYYGVCGRVKALAPVELDTLVKYVMDAAG
jgi:predicted GH43/DUF377 family glycosyl hydrolase